MSWILFNTHFAVGHLPLSVGKLQLYHRTTQLFNDAVANSTIK